MPQKQKTAHLQRAAANDTHTSQFSEETEEAEAQTEAAATYAVSNTELRRTISNPRGASPQAILGLQARYGNQAVQRMLATTGRTEVQRGFLGDFKKNLAKTFSRQKQKNKIAELNDEEAVDYMIKDPPGNKLFRTYSINEFSIENLDAYEFILAFDQAGQPFEKAQAFSQRFMQRSSEQEINVPAEVAKTFSRLLKEDNPGPYLVDKVKAAIMVNLLDTFARYRMTEQYQQWENSKTVPDAAI